MIVRVIGRGWPFIEGPQGKVASDGNLEARHGGKSGSDAKCASVLEYALLRQIRGVLRGAERPSQRRTGECGCRCWTFQ